MKIIQKSALVFIVIMIVVSCTKKETAPPTAGATNSVLLAGPKGSSISWKIASISLAVNGTTQTVVPATSSTSLGIPACEVDNTFQFSYSSSQSYQQTEGATSCTAGDPATIEKGSWAFTDDGKTLLIDGTVNITTTQVQLPAEPFLGFMILDGQSLTVTQLTATSLTLSYTYIDSNSATNVVTLVFSKM